MDDDEDDNNNTTHPHSVTTNGQLFTDFLNKNNFKKLGVSAGTRQV